MTLTLPKRTTPRRGRRRASPRRGPATHLRARLGEVIERSGLSQAAFAREIHVDRSTLTQILSSRDDRLPRAETLVRVAQHSGVRVDWLLGLADESTPGLEIVPQARASPDDQPSIDDQIDAWHAEDTGTKVRHVPVSLPDLLKTEALIDYEYQRAAITMPEQRRQANLVALERHRSGRADLECCSSVQSVAALAFGEGIWRDLPIDVRRAQLQHMIDLVDALYPSLRWFLFDGRNRFSAPLSIFGTDRAVVYLGQRYLYAEGREAVHQLASHFDDLIRAAIFRPHEVSRLLTQLVRQLSPPEESSRRSASRR